MAKGPNDKGAAMPASKNTTGGVMKAPKPKKMAPVAVGTKMPRKGK